MQNKTPDELSVQELLDRVAEYTQQNYATRAELAAAKKEIEASEKLLGIKAEPAAILEYKNKLEKTMRTALKNIDTLEKELLQKEAGTCDDTNRQWAEEIANTENAAGDATGDINT